MITLDQSKVDALGLEHDRRWMVVDSQGKFVTQREFRPLSQLLAVPSENGLRLEVNGHQLDVPVPDARHRRDVSVWRSDVNAADCGPAVREFLLQQFEREFSLVYYDANTARTTNRDWSEPESPVSFADGYPVLIASQGSLEAINDRLAETGEQRVTMTRFRPNIVISGAPAWAEDGWQTIKIGDILFDLVKPCDRCIMTTNDPETGERPNNEPMTTLAQFRRSGDARIRGVLFGWNAVPRGSGMLKVGDVVDIEAQRPVPWPILPPKPAG